MMSYSEMHASEDSVHVFDNGVRVYARHLLSIQLDRYKQRNVHEAVEEDVFLSLLARMPGNGVFMNIGAAIGYYAILGKTRRPDLRLVCLEPLPLHIEYFKQNAALNGLRDSDFELIHKAVAPFEGTADFKDESYGSYVMLQATNDAQNLLKVQTITLRQLINHAGGNVDLLQMDIQGLEGAVLKSFFADPDSRGRVGTFLIGTHSEAVHIECLDYFRANGYAIEYDDAYPKNQPDGIIVAKKAYA